jgi:hypothetical protein
MRKREWKQAERPVDVFATLLLVYHAEMSALSYRQANT